ncbi:MAG: hypothetical protein WCF57_09330 [Pyrinomonadaceae bacterium]
MQTARDKHIQIIERELRFISRHVQIIEGAGGSDFGAVDEICMSVNSALRALSEYRLSLRPANEEVPAGLSVAA